MKQPLATILIAVAACVLLVTALALTGVIQFQQDKGQGFRNKGKLELVCDIDFMRPVNGLGQPPEISNLVVPAEIDFEENTGWFSGEYAISASRKGTLNINEGMLVVNRPAMFQRYGLTITGDHFSLDRKNGNFRQWLELKGEKKLDTATGTCKRKDKLPF